MYILLYTAHITFVYTWCLIHKFTQCYSSLQCFRSPTAQMPVPQKLQPRLCWHLRVKSRTNTRDWPPKWEYESRMIMDNTHFIAFPGPNSSPTFNPTDKGAPAKFSSGVRRLVELELVPWWWLNLNKDRMTVTVHDGWITAGSLEQIGWGVVQLYISTCVKQQPKLPMLVDQPTCIYQNLQGIPMRECIQVLLKCECSCSSKHDSD